MNVGEDHIFDFGEIVGVLDAIHLLLKLPVGQIGHIVNICSVFLGGEVESVTQVLVLNRQLEVGLHSVLVLLRHTEQILTQLHVADQDFLDDANAGNQTVLRVRCSHLVGMVAQHRHS